MICTFSGRSALRLRSIFVLPCFALGVLAGCSDSGDTDLATFEMKVAGDGSGEETFRVVTDDPAVIESARAQLALPQGERKLHAAGAVAYGDGDFNLDWGWHFQPNDWALREVSTESCDTTPSQIDQDVDYWVTTASGACPWGAYVASEVTD